MRDVEPNKTSGQTKHNSDPSVHEAATCVYDFLRTKAQGGVISNHHMAANQKQTQTWHKSWYLLLGPKKEKFEF